MDTYEYNPLLAIFSGGVLLFFLFLLLIQVISLWKVFTKAGYGGWEVLIPIYNLYILLKIVGKPGWWIILFLVPVVNVVFGIWTANMLSKSFGKDEGFTVGLVLLRTIFLAILGFGSAPYLGPYGDQAAFQAHQSRQKFDFNRI